MPHYTDWSGKRVRRKLNKVQKRQRSLSRRARKNKSRIAELQKPNTDLGMVDLAAKNTIVSYGNMPLSSGAAGGCDPLTCSDGCCYKAYLPGTSSNPWALKSDRNPADIQKIVMLFLHGAATGVDNYADLLTELQESLWDDAGVSLAIIAPNTLLNGLTALDELAFADAATKAIDKFRTGKSEWGQWGLSGTGWIVGGHSAGGSSGVLMCCSGDAGNFADFKTAVVPDEGDDFVKGLFCLDAVFTGALDPIKTAVLHTANVAIYGTIKNCAGGFPTSPQVELPSELAANLVQAGGVSGSKADLRIGNVNLNYKKGFGLKSSYKWAWHCGWEQSSLRPLANGCEILATILPGLTCPSYPSGPDYTYNNSGQPKAVLPPAFQSSGKSWGLLDVFAFSLSPKYQTAVTMASLPQFVVAALVGSGDRDEAWSNFNGVLINSGGTIPGQDQTSGWSSSAMQRLDTKYKTTSFFGLLPESFHFSTTSAYYE